ncbi:hypothetical protein [Bradyrhizobium sp. 23AC]
MSNRTLGRRMPTAAEREAQKAFRDTGAKAPVSEHERDQQAFHANRERLKAERLAREAASTESGAGATSAKPRKRPRSHRIQDR